MKQLFPTLSPSDRLKSLQDNADQIEEGFSFMHQLEPDELLSKKDTLVEEAQQISDKETAFSEISKIHREEMKEAKKSFTKLQHEIKTGLVETIATVYLLANHDNGMMEYYDAGGIMIYSRRQRPEEKQGNILSLNIKNA